ncbi:hypothetical protein AVEN_210520-1 [Araneus ventricosus]|uniref:Uncharacterized protein n=1 Tax=Araneus ventricosus TaxID=182803 RepID=A0A4Y2FGU2_ARAVE|nr:hypothetical protein AVEN_210520-1 [Araneus ventricosus]
MPTDPWNQNISGRARRPSGNVSASGSEGSRPKLDTTEGSPYLWVWYTLNITWVKLPPTGLEREVPAQVLSSSCDRDSKLRGLSENSCRVACKMGREYN